MTADIVQLKEGSFQITGKVTFATVAAITKKFLVFFDKGILASPVVIDLSQMTQVDSAALAMLIEWLRQAKQHKLRLELHHPTPSLLALARVVHLENIFTGI